MNKKIEWSLVREHSKDGAIAGGEIGGFNYYINIEPLAKTLNMYAFIPSNSILRGIPLSLLYLHAPRPLSEICIHTEGEMRNALTYRYNTLVDADIINYDEEGLWKGGNAQAYAIEKNKKRISKPELIMAARYFMRQLLSREELAQHVASSLDIRKVSGLGTNAKLNPKNPIRRVNI